MLRLILGQAMGRPSRAPYDRLPKLSARRYTHPQSTNQQILTVTLHHTAWRCPHHCLLARLLHSFQWESREALLLRKPWHMTLREWAAQAVRAQALAQCARLRAPRSMATACLAAEAAVARRG